MPNLGPTELIIIGFVLLIVAAIVATLLRSQSAAGGQRLLRRWGIPEPTPEQGEAAALDLRRRRLRYGPIFVGVWLAVAVVRGLADAPGRTNWFLVLLGTVVASALIGEVSAVIRPALRSRRSASLVRRGITDLVPLYGIVVLAGTAVVAMFAVVSSLLVVPVKGPIEFAGIATMWALLAALLLVLAGWAAVVWLSLIRGPLYDDGAVDAALRIRAARVTTGTALLVTWWATGFAFGRINDVLAGAGSAVEGQPALVLFADRVHEPAVTISFIAGVLTWALLVNPIRKQRLVEASR